MSRSSRVKAKSPESSSSFEPSATASTDYDSESVKEESVKEEMDIDEWQQLEEEPEEPMEIIFASMNEILAASARLGAPRRFRPRLGNMDVAEVLAEHHEWRFYQDWLARETRRGRNVRAADRLPGAAKKMLSERSYIVDMLPEILLYMPENSTTEDAVVELEYKRQRLGIEI
ncbi:hypothetical protein BGZ73_008039 [Actinomortierella ambigua]|nr:hypothetical protein BGZ73_008039 [Actinomortierella ambigua]